MWVKLKTILDQVPEKYYKRIAELNLPYRSNSNINKFGGYLIRILDENTIDVDGPSPYINISRKYSLNEDEVEITGTKEETIVAIIFSENE